MGKQSSKFRKPAKLVPRTLRIEALEARAMLSGTGLTGQYFHNEDFTGLAAERTEAVAFNWGASSPAPGVAEDTFSVRWTGQVEAVYSEQYTFYTTSNQGVRLWIDGELLVDNWKPHNSEVDSATIELEAGQKYDLRIDYYEHFGSAEMKLEWSSPSQSRQVVPENRLYASPEGLRGEYSDAFGGSAVRIDPVLDFNWGVGRAHPSVAVDQISVEWTGQIRPDHSEEYLFSSENDEGVRVWIGNELVIDDWTPHTTHVATGAKMLEAGKWYDIRIEYFDKTGNAEIDLQWSSESQTGDGAFAVVPSSHLRASQAAPLQFTNPLGPGADPYATYYDGQYYLVDTTANNVRMERAERLEDIHYSNSNSASTVVWNPPGGTNYSKQIWAPELHRLNGKWYIYVAASDGNNANHRMHVLERDDPDPMGPFTYKGQLATHAGSFAIDGTVLEWQGQLYHIWSGWPGSTDGVQNLYIAEMSNPWTISSNRVMLSTPTYAWEKHGLSINEGPQVLKHDGSLHIIYSGSGYWRHEYALGRLTYDGVGPIMSANSWQKSPTPVFKQAGDIVGTGHASFTTSPDGSENWIVYHAHHDKHHFQDDRDIYIQPFAFNTDGTPDFGSPIPAEVPMTVPSGTADPERPFVEGDYDASGAVDGSDLEVWQAQYGATVIPGISADSSQTGLVEGSDFLTWQQNFGATPLPESTLAYWRHEEGAAGEEIGAGANTVRDESGHANHMRTFSSSFSAATYTSAVSPIPLRSGEANTRSLDFGPGGDDAGLNDDNYTDAKPINSANFSELTVEFAFNMNSIGGFQTLVGKDGKPTSSPVAPLQIKVRGDNFPGGINNQLFVEWIDGDGDNHFLSSGASITEGNWNHVAFVLTESDAKLFIMAETGDYTLTDSISGEDFAGAGGEVLINATGQFTVGRGMYNNHAADWSDALIDEVRVSNRALAATEFLFDSSATLALASAPSFTETFANFLPYSFVSPGSSLASRLSSQFSTNQQLRHHTDRDTEVAQFRENLKPSQQSSGELFSAQDNSREGLDLAQQHRQSDNVWEEAFAELDRDNTWKLSAISPLQTQPLT